MFLQALAVHGINIERNLKPANCPGAKFSRDGSYWPLKQAHKVPCTRICLLFPDTVTLSKAGFAGSAFKSVTCTPG